mgnify:CR=1 FL=1
MPSASTLQRAWRRPMKAYAHVGRSPRPLLGQRPFLDPIAAVPESAFRPGVTFDLFGRNSERLGWGRVAADGTIELFDVDSNRLRSVRPTFRMFSDGNGAGLDLKKTIEAIILQHPDWDREQIKVELRRQQKEVSR